MSEEETTSAEPQDAGAPAGAPQEYHGSADINPGDAGSADIGSDDLLAMIQQTGGGNEAMA